MSLADRAIPNLMTALTGTYKMATGVLEKPDDFSVQCSAHELGSARDFVSRDLNAHFLAAFSEAV